jgi:hypothetical protein
MSDMRKLLESMDKFAGEPEQKAGDQVRGTDNPKKSGQKHGFGDRLVGEDHELTESLMKEYRDFVEMAPGTPAANPTSPVANINPAGTGVANVAATGSSVKPIQPGQPVQQQTPQQAAALAQKEKLDLTKNIGTLKTIDPNLNVGKITAAMQKDPSKVTAVDAQQLAQLSNTLEPVIKNTAGMSNLRSLAQRMGKT